MPRVGHALLRHSSILTIDSKRCAAEVRKLDAIQAWPDLRATDQLTDTTSRLEVGREFFLAALALLRDPQAFYRRGGTSLKRARNKIIFTQAVRGRRRDHRP